VAVPTKDGAVCERVALKDRLQNAPFASCSRRAARTTCTTEPGSSDASNSPYARESEDRHITRISLLAPHPSVLKVHARARGLTLALARHMDSNRCSLMASPSLMFLLSAVSATIDSLGRKRKMQ